MAAINFPSSPTQGQSYTENGQTWYYDGVKWVSGGTFGQSALTPMYQQGVWTPTTNLGAAEVINNASWERIGNLVKIQASLASFNNSASSVIGVGNWPYQPSAESLGSVMCSKFDNAATASFIGVGSSALISFFRNSTSKNDNWRQVLYSDRLDANSTIWFAISYRTDDTTWTPLNGATVS